MNTKITIQETELEAPVYQAEVKGTIKNERCEGEVVYQIISPSNLPPDFIMNEESRAMLGVSEEVKVTTSSEDGITTAVLHTYYDANEADDGICLIIEKNDRCIREIRKRFDEGDEPLTEDELQVLREVGMLEFYENSRSEEHLDMVRRYACGGFAFALILDRLGASDVRDQILRDDSSLKEDRQFDITSLELVTDAIVAIADGDLLLSPDIEEQFKEMVPAILTCANTLGSLKHRLENIGRGDIERS